MGAVNMAVQNLKVGGKGLVTDKSFPRARKVEISYAKIGCLINAEFVVPLDHLVLGNDDIEEF